MATRGRKPLPTALKVLEGDRGKGRRPLNTDEPTPPQVNVECPDWLMPEAQQEWQNRSRAESWTPEMKEKAREKARRKNDGKNSN